MLPEDAGAIRSACSGEESRPWAESRETGSAPKDGRGSHACSSVATGLTSADILSELHAAIVVLEGWRKMEAARARLLALAASLRSAGSLRVR